MTTTTGKGGRKERERKAQIRNEARERKATELAAGELSWDIYHSPIAELNAHIPAESVDVILTDPPYPKKFLPQWGELADFAEYALKPGGTLAAMNGPMYFPEIFAMFTERKRLTYRWMMVLAGLNQATQIHPRRIGSGSKVMFLYTKGDDHGNRWIRDTVLATPMSIREIEYYKKDHEWGQEQGLVNEIARRICEPGDVVCDPFIGAGSSGIAALRLGCRFLGADVDYGYVLVSDDKLEKWDRDTKEMREKAWREAQIEQIALF